MTDNNTRAISERRNTARHPVVLDVNYRHGDTYLFSRSSNLSEVGIFLVSSKPLEMGTEFDLRFRSGEGGDLIEVRGRVAWIQSSGDGCSGGMGVEFLSPSDGVMKRLRVLIRTVAYLED